MRVTGADDNRNVVSRRCSQWRHEASTTERWAKPACASLAMALSMFVQSAKAQDADGMWWVDRAASITVTATRTEKPVVDVPATVTVITAGQIADTLSADIKDLVRFEPGVSVQRSASRYTAASSGNDARSGIGGFNIRGLDGNRVLIQVDGIRVPDAFSFGGQSVGRGDYVDLGVLKSVEILRGPASALYGSDGLAGAVSFVTTDPVDVLGKNKSFGGSARVSYESANRQVAEGAMLAGRSGDWSALLALTRRDGHELDNMGTVDTLTSTRTTPNPQTTASNAILGKLVWAPSAATQVRLTVDHYDDLTRTHVLTANTATSLDTEARDTTRRNRVSLDARQDHWGPIDQLHVTAYWQQSKNRQFTAEDRAAPLVDRTRINIFNNRTIGVSTDLRSGFATGPVQHTLQWGGDWSITRQEGIRDGTVPPVGESFPTRAFPVTDYTLEGLFVGDELSIASGRLTLFPVLRFDHFDLDAHADPAIPTLTAVGKRGSHVSPKIGAVAKLSETVRLFANYASGFKAPEPSQVNQFFENPVYHYRTIPNANLKPETSQTIEGGLRINTPAVAFSVTGFSGHYHNFISQEVVGTSGDGFMLFQNINLSSVHISGAEAQLKLQSASGLYGNLALSYASGTVDPGTSSEAGLLSIDPAKLVMGLGYRDKAGRFGGQIIMTHAAGKSASSVRAAGAVSGCAATADCIRPGAFTILDMTAFARLAENLTLRAGLFNLLNTKYTWWSDIRPLAATAANLAIADSYTQPGRNVSVSLTARF